MYLNTNIVPLGTDPIRQIRETGSINHRIPETDQWTGLTI